MSKKQDKSRTERAQVVLPRLRAWRLRAALTQDELAYFGGSEGLPSMSRTTIVAAEQGKPIGTKSAQLLADKLGARLGESITIFDLTDGGGRRDKHDGAAILDEVREWQVERWGPINTAANGLQWRACVLRHRLVRDRVDRGKQYDLLAHLSDGLRGALRESLTRHAEVCDRVGDHPNIARNRAVFQDDRSLGIWWVVDEGLEGQALAAVLESGPLDKDRLKVTMCDIVAGLEALHRAQIIRRELSPRFIYITDTRAVLTDFELAKLLTGRPTVSVDHWPEDPYRAPEIRDGAVLAPQADLYSWAMILAHCLSGQVPDGPRDARAMLQSASLPSAVVKTASTCLGPVARRPRSAAAVSKVLRTWR